MRAQALRLVLVAVGFLPVPARTKAGAIAPNLLDRRFEAEGPNEKWVADFTCFWTAEGRSHVEAVIDLFSRRVVGWSMKAEMTARRVTDTLVMAIRRRGRRTHCCILPNAVADTPAISSNACSPTPASLGLAGGRHELRLAARTTRDGADAPPEPSHAGSRICDDVFRRRPSPEAGRNDERSGPPDRAGRAHRRRRADRRPLERVAGDAGIRQCP
jgi:hypothetical protein